MRHSLPVNDHNIFCGRNDIRLNDNQQNDTQRTWNLPFCWISFFKMLIYSVIMLNIISVSLIILSVIMLNRHERDSRQSQSRSGEISTVLRHRFAGFWLKVPFVSVHFSGPAIFWTKHCDTPPVCEMWLFRAGQGTAKWQKMPIKEQQCSVRVRSEKKFCSSIVKGQKNS